MTCKRIGYIMLITIIFIIHFNNNLYSQNIKNDSDRINLENIIILDNALRRAYDKKEIKAIADSIEKKYFTWTVKEKSGSSLMYIDIPYPNMINNFDYLSITLVKLNSEKRPKILSFAFSDTIDASKKLVMAFGLWMPNSTLYIDSVLYYLPITDHSEFLKVSLDKGYYYDHGVTIDIFHRFLNSDFVFYGLSGRDGKTYQVSLPLYTFKQTWLNLR